MDRFIRNRRWSWSISRLFERGIKLGSSEVVADNSAWEKLRKEFYWVARVSAVENMAIRMAHADWNNRREVFWIELDLLRLAETLPNNAKALWDTFAPLWLRDSPSEIQQPKDYEVHRRVRPSLRRYLLCFLRLIGYRR